MIFDCKLQILYKSQCDPRGSWGQVLAKKIFGHFPQFIFMEASIPHDRAGLDPKIAVFRRFGPPNRVFTPKCDCKSRFKSGRGSTEMVVWGSQPHMGALAPQIVSSTSGFGLKYPQIDQDLPVRTHPPHQNCSKTRSRTI